MNGPQMYVSKATRMGLRVLGPDVNRAALLSFLTAMVDAPAAEGEEIVEAVLDRPRRQVVTDKRVYAVPAGAAVTVKVGDALKLGDPLTDAVLFTELAYRLPGPDMLPALVGGPALLVGPYRHALTFPNRMERIGLDGGRQRFTVHGDPEDIAAFWRGVDAQSGLALVNKLVNPAQALLSCLRGHGVFVRLNARSFGALAAPGLVMEFLRRALAPHLVALSYMEHAAAGEDIVLTAPDEEFKFVKFLNVDEAVGVSSVDGVAMGAVSMC
jgi:hypothetical protein